jgi:hypothetical protein
MGEKKRMDILLGVQSNNNDILQSGDDVRV